MKFKYWLSVLSAVLALSGLSSPAAAQDDAFDIGTTQRSYNYIQAVYLFDQDPIEYPVVVNAQVSVHPNIVLLGEYVDLFATQPVPAADGNTYQVKTQILSTEVGVGFHLASKRWTRLDWLAQVLYSTTKFDTRVVGDRVPANNPRIKSSSSSYAFQLGARASVTPKFEVQALGITFYQSERGFANELLQLSAVYRVFDRLDIAVGVRDATDTQNYNLGLRYNW